MSNLAQGAFFEAAFSRPRLARYASNPRKVDALLAYQHNLQLAEAIMPCLHVLEVALRNAVHNQLRAKYKRDDWWDKVATFKERDLKEIKKAIGKISDKGQAVTPDRIVSELSFGFWVSLFYVQHEHELWKELRLAFPRCPSQRRKRKTISSHLSAARDLRNRAAHHDALLWLAPDMRQKYLNCLELIGWLEPQLKEWLGLVDRFPQAWQAWMATKPQPVP